MKIVFLEPLGIQPETIKAACKKIIAKGHEVVIYPDRKPEMNIERATGADIVIESNMPLKQDFFDACPNLKMLSIAFTGLDHIDMGACRKSNIKVMNAAGYSTQAVAELAIGMMIDLSRHILENDAITRSCSKPAWVPGNEIGGKTVGIIGMGKIGQRIASLCNAFGCQVLGWNRSPKEIEGVEMVSKETLLSVSDFVVVQIALNDETRNFIAAHELSLMKPTALLINAARGAIVNAGDLAEALQTKRIAGAALDVYDQEPPLKSNNPLLQAPHTLLLPHIGFATHEAFEQRLNIVVDNVERFLEV